MNLNAVILIVGFMLFDLKSVISTLLVPGAGAVLAMTTASGSLLLVRMVLPFESRIGNRAMDYSTGSTM